MPGFRTSACGRSPQNYVLLSVGFVCLAVRKLNGDYNILVERRHVVFACMRCVINLPVHISPPNLPQIRTIRMVRGKVHNMNEL